MTKKIITSKSNPNIDKEYEEASAELDLEEFLEKMKCDFCKQPLDPDYYHMFKFGMRHKNHAKKDPARKIEVEKLYRIQINLCCDCEIKMISFIERQKAKARRKEKLKGAE